MFNSLANEKWKNEEMRNYLNRSIDDLGKNQMTYERLKHSIDRNKL